MVELFCSAGACPPLFHCSANPCATHLGFLGSVLSIRRDADWPYTRYHMRCTLQVQTAKHIVMNTKA